MTPAPGAPAGRVDGVLLDVDDTLVDTKGAFATALVAVADAHLPPDVDHAALLDHWRSDPGGHYARYTRGETDHRTQRRLRADLLHRTFGGAPVGEQAFDAWDDLFWGTFERSWRPFADAAPFLAALRAAGLAVGVVTNAGTVLQERKLTATGLDVPVLVGVDTLGFGKPHPDVFHEGARLLGTAPGRTAYVGDEPRVDALAAHDAGLLGVWLDRPGARRGGEHDADPAAMRADGIVVVPGLPEALAALRG
ncbi:putative hydrolase of the HAD superfamily [Isoptericola jiangsuensis]|uniref:Putative hydrolase of the HAD superfamily n=1 Tax=Isoptericola jiangsuensis TaxID=548579 RepID=A0A2A9EXP1_9MICO|nr:HAD family hydrolase [Isoptericola jiangsuensis]PFG43814.1 putative hydrolase of the HAD superfamily [Isoptericola jiangsuensis]